MTFITNYRYHILFVLATIVYAIGLFNFELMDVDASQYASISFEMLQSADFLHVKDQFHDYLDKPPLLFWLGALSLKIFGVHDWAYRFPSFLCTLLGIWSVFKLSLTLYNRQIALNAALMVFTCQAFFLFNHDVRTDTLLTDFVIFSIWQLVVFINKNKFKNLFLGFFGIGLAMLAKGPIGFIVPVFSIGSWVLLKRDFKSIFKWQWLPGLLITALVLLPMCIGLYEQFDLHPEKVVNGKTGVSGLRFFFWDQSFGRITGTNEWKNDTGYLFFTHTFIWAFLPWAFLSVAALFSGIYKLATRKGYYSEKEFLCIGGFLLSFIALSLSQYKLPHYIFVVFPLAAIFTSAWLYDLQQKSEKKYSAAVIFQNVLCFLLIPALILINVWFFPIYKNTLALIISVGVLLIVFLFLNVKENGKRSAIYFSAATIIFVNLLLNLNFYPSLLKYQAGSVAGKYIRDNKIDTKKTFALHVAPYSLMFYSQHIFRYINEDMIADSIKKYRSVWIFTRQEGYDELKKRNYKIVSEMKMQDYEVTALTLPFLVPASREKELKCRYLLQVSE